MFWRARGYGGAPMLDSAARVVGHLAFVNDALSDDIASRFRDRGWSEHALSVEM